MTPADLPPRMARRVVIDAAGCWLWTGCKTTNGYGRTWMPGTRMWRRTHRIAYEALVGPVPAGLDLDHLCRVRACCNPLHLEPVTRSQNMWRSPLSGAKTHCINGHEYRDENTYVCTDGHRRCRECRRAARRRIRRAA